MKIFTRRILRSPDGEVGGESGTEKKVPADSNQMQEQVPAGQVPAETKAPADDSEVKKLRQEAAKYRTERNDLQKQLEANNQLLGSLKKAIGGETDDNTPEALQKRISDAQQQAMATSEKAKQALFKAELKSRLMQDGVKPSLVDVAMKAFHADLYKSEAVDLDSSSVDLGESYGEILTKYSDMFTKSTTEPGPQKPAVKPIEQKGPQQPLSAEERALNAGMQAWGLAPKKG